VATSSAPRTARARARAEITREIKAVARRHLAEAGASSLSLRAVARELGMVSSAVYRYFPSRDELLTALIIDAYDALGAAAEAADARCPAGDVDGRWMAVCRAVRAWGLADPHEYALIYGSPVPGYRAPQDTIGPATRVTTVLVGILRDGVRLGAFAAGGEDIPEVVRADFDHHLRPFAPDVPDAVLARGLAAWTNLFGFVSFELFGHFHQVVDERDALFEHLMARVGRALAAPG
jgi:AcrR family transcriptional regulator